jgi:transketolase
MQYRSSEPDWPERDRFILSKGHGCLAQYVLLADKGFFPKSDLGSFCHFGSHLGGHPEGGLTPGVEAATGSLGHGPSIGVGLTLAIRLDRRAARVFVVCGDGETNEGSIWEALLSAAKHKLDNLTIIVDYNKIQSWDTVAEILPLEPYADKYRSFGCAVAEVDGHDPKALLELFQRLPLENSKPTAIIAHTIKGRGIAELEGDLSWHHKTNISKQQYHDLLAKLESRE